LHVDRDPERILQIACGNGEGALFLAREFPRARVRGVDNSAAAIRTAVDRVGLDPEGRIAFKAGEATALPFPDDLFDLVVQIDSLPSPAEVARVLRPGGYVLLAFERRPRGLARMRLRRLRDGLKRQGIEPVESDEAGDGEFHVARLRDDD
jgi:ubiquinone/menaquinone biosynthesis C-methylase UbiE